MIQIHFQIHDTKEMSSDGSARTPSGAAPVFLISLKAGGVGLNLTSARPKRRAVEQRITETG
jgi:hypothetical protein